MRQLADASVSHELGRVPELRRRALLASDLENPAGAVHRVAQGATLGDRQRRRLLQVDVLPRLHGVNGDQRVPVIGRADDDRVDVLVRQQLAIVAVGGHPVVLLAGLLRVVIVDERPRIFDAMAVEIAGRHDPRAVVLPEARQIVAARDPSVADRADVDAIGRAQLAPSTDDGTMDGKPATTDAAPSPFPAAARKSRREGRTASLSRHVELLLSAGRYEAPLSGQAHALRLFLRLEHQFGREETMLLRHRRLGAVHDIGDQRAAVRQHHILAIDVARLLLVDEKQMALARPAGDVDVLPHLDEAVRAEHSQPPVAPRRQAVGREPVDADVAGAASPRSITSPKSSNAGYSG